ncbi:MAG: hypothetical protein H0V24_00080 [Chloroflexia bacterium]|nr:hypothetical protein [Chloroflexia bacterium]
MNRRTFALAGLALLPATTTALAEPKPRTAGSERTSQTADARRTKNTTKPKRKIVTRTFANPRAITILDNEPAAPYPSTITVSDLP